MPRHPPNALLTLDRSHCQCPSSSGPYRLSKKSVDFLGIWTSIRRPAVKGAIRPTLGSQGPKHHQKMYWLNFLICSLSVKQPFRQLTQGTRRAFPEHIRPASRDVSNDARSGNANRHAVIRTTRRQQQSRSIIRHGRSGKGCKPRHEGTAFRHNLLFTMYAEQASLKAMQFLISQGLRRIARHQRATARRQPFGAPAEHRPEGPLMREHQPFEHSSHGLLRLRSIHWIDRFGCAKPA